LSNIDNNNSSSNSSIIGNHDNDEVIVSIKDRGAGIDPDIQADYSLNL
jgi:C4-dicarboxylate-specific signal transduction histidine kinase